jgi:hypothetical protein
LSLSIGSDPGPLTNLGTFPSWELKSVFVFCARRRGILGEPLLLPLLLRSGVLKSTGEPDAVQRIGRSHHQGVEPHGRRVPGSTDADGAQRLGRGACAGPGDPDAVQRIGRCHHQGVAPHGRRVPGGADADGAQRLGRGACAGPGEPDAVQRIGRCHHHGVAAEPMSRAQPYVAKRSGARVASGLACVDAGLVFAAACLGGLRC